MNFLDRVINACKVELDVLNRMMVDVEDDELEIYKQEIEDIEKIEEFVVNLKG